MLMQNFKPADKLGLTEIEKQALIKAMTMLEQGLIKHIKSYDYDTHAESDGAAFTGHFNMDQWCMPATCGTVACIGGTAELVGKLPRGSLD